MNPKSIMLIAGETSGDELAAELVQALRRELASAEARPTLDYQPLHTSLEPTFFGAGGPRMAAGGVELSFDLTKHSLIGVSDALKKYFSFRRLFQRLFREALARQPDAIVCVDFAGFNLRFASAIRRYVARRADWFHDWRPKIIQYVSPQVWASRAGRAMRIARDYDLLVSIFPFEKEWYQQRVPQLRVEFVGHPLVERYGKGRGSPDRTGRKAGGGEGGAARTPPVILLLPGSRPGELERHLQVLAETAQRIATVRKAIFRMVLPDEFLAARAKAVEQCSPGIEVQTGGLEEVLGRADIAITKSGTITLECALLGVPAVVFYKTSPLTYLMGKQLVKVKHIAMPNLLARQSVFPEFIQRAATPENLARAALELLDDEPRRSGLAGALRQIATALGPPGASQRAARVIARLLEPPSGSD